MEHTNAGREGSAGRTHVVSAGALPRHVSPMGSGNGVRMASRIARRHAHALAHTLGSTPVAR